MLFKQTKYCYLLMVVFLGIYPTIIYSANNVILEVDGLSYNKLIGKKIHYLEDKNNNLEIEEVIQSNDFKLSQKDVPNFGITNSAFWLKVIIKNESEEILLLELAHPIMDEVEFYDYKINSVVKIGESVPFYNRKYLFTNYIFDLNIEPKETKTYFLKIKSTEQIQVPIFVGSLLSISERSIDFTFYASIFFGVMMVMILYNFFVFVSTKDTSYIYYVIYIFILMLTQLSPKGFTFQYFWPNSSWLAIHSMFLLPSLVGISGIIFFNNFLKTKEFLPLAKKIFKPIIIIYLIVITLSIIGVYKISYIIMEINAMVVALLMLVFAFLISKKGYPPAKYFLIAWSVFLIGIFLWVLKDIGVLPYNNLTNNFMQIGSGIETVLLSFALAARINIYKKERLEAIAEKERLVREQNIVLEQQVVERTKSLNETLDNLKQTQSQLVEAEKMASLGQLTAGIAHEVNNPINFITSNIYPLREDIKDIKAILNKYAEINTSSNLTEKLEEIEHLKEELQYDYLLNELDGIIHGIEDGAMRTAEIVSGLRNFSRLDESDLKLADINEGINSTLLLLKSKIGDVKLIKKLENLPQIECYPGKINQLVLNIVDNAIFAIKEKGIPLTEGEIEVKTVAKENEVVLTIKDNGVGMNEQTKQKIFDPFFTTKDVGEGTGLGLSIVFGIIKKHNATIEITSELGIGTEFKISLPINNK